MKAIIVEDQRMYIINASRTLIISAVIFVLIYMEMQLIIFGISLFSMMYANNT